MLPDTLSGPSVRFTPLYQFAFGGETLKKFIAELFGRRIAYERKDEPIPLFLNLIRRSHKNYRRKVSWQSVMKALKKTDQSSLERLKKPKYFPNWKPEGYICLSDLNQFRMQYIQNLLESEKGELRRVGYYESLQLSNT